MARQKTVSRQKSQRSRDPNPKSRDRSRQHHKLSDNSSSVVNRSAGSNAKKMANRQKSLSTSKSKRRHSRPIRHLVNVKSNKSVSRRHRLTSARPGRSVKATRSISDNGKRLAKVTKHRRAATTMPPKRHYQYATKKSNLHDTASAIFEGVEDNSSLKEVFQRVISDLMTQRNRRTTLHYVRVESSPRNGRIATTENSEESFTLMHTPKTFPRGGRHYAQTQSSEDSNLSSVRDMSLSPTYSTAAAEESSTKSLVTVKEKSLSRTFNEKSLTPTKRTPKRDNDRLYIDGPEYVNWLSQNTTENSKLLKYPTIPHDVRLASQPISGVFQSQLAKYRTEAQKKKMAHMDFEKYLEEKRAGMEGNDISCWMTPSSSTVTKERKPDVMVDTPSPDLYSTKASSDTSGPLIRMRSGDFSNQMDFSQMPVSLHRMEELQGSCFGLLESMKRLELSVADSHGVLPKTPEKSLSLVTANSSWSSASHQDRPLSLPRSVSSFAPSIYSTPLTAAKRSSVSPLSHLPSSSSAQERRGIIPRQRRTVSESTLLTNARLQPRARLTQSSFSGRESGNVRSSPAFVSTFRIPSTTKKQQWLVEAARLLERAQLEGKTAVLSTSLPKKSKRSLPVKREMSSTSPASLLSNSGKQEHSAANYSPAFVTATDLTNAAALPDIGKETSEELHKYRHRKKIHVRFMVDKDKSLEADYSIEFESKKEHPSVKVMELFVDNRPVWREAPRNVSGMVTPSTKTPSTLKTIASAEQLMSDRRFSTAHTSTSSSASTSNSETPPRRVDGGNPLALPSSSFNHP